MYFGGKFVKKYIWQNNKENGYANTYMVLCDSSVET
jgi:thiamine biosynthesis protein ThiC